MSRWAIFDDVELALVSRALNLVFQPEDLKYRRELDEEFRVRGLSDRTARTWPITGPCS